MMYDVFGQPLTTEEELFEMVLKMPHLKLERFQVDDPTKFNNAVQSLYLDYPLLHKYHSTDMTVEAFDQRNQSIWNMPEEYSTFDIKEYCLSLCSDDIARQRVEDEYKKYEEFEIVKLLQYLKYMVDTFRKNNIVWGVGRGSSVASYILYLIGVHKIDSIKFKIPMEEFLK